MTYRVSNKLPSIDNNSIYWSSRDLIMDSDTTESTRRISSPYYPHHHRKHQKQDAFIDPWDLENYVYISRTIDTSTLPSTTPSPAGEPISSTFYYIPGSTGAGGDDIDCTGCNAGLDEELFYNAKYESIQDDDPAYSIYYTDLESSSTEHHSNNSSCSGEGSTVSTLQLHTPGFGMRASGRRSIVLPKPIPRIEFPAPPPPPPIDPFEQQQLEHEEYLNYQHHKNQHNMLRRRSLSVPPMSTTMQDNSYCSLSDCYDCLIENVPLYATNNRTMSKHELLHHHQEQQYYQQQQHPHSSYPPHHFGLSKKGLLQIDYSLNWNNLHRFIAK